MNYMPVYPIFGAIHMTPDTNMGYGAIGTTHEMRNKVVEELILT